MEKNDNKESDMKKWIAAGILPLLLAGCGSSDYVHSKEPRSIVYYGQPVADLYENFGTPTKATRISDTERILIYVSQEIEKEWAYRYVRGCVMQFRLVNERVVDWAADGQACVIQSRQGDDMSSINQSSPYDEGGLFDSAGSSTTSTQTVYQTGDKQVPTDAFHGKAPTTYSPISSITTPENTYRGKASASYSRSGQLPADAFDGKASATYHMSQTGVLSNSGMKTTGVAQLPADAFHGQASTVYTPQMQSTGGQMINNQNSYTSSPNTGRLPADAFDGKASTSVSSYQNGQFVRQAGNVSQSNSRPVFPAEPNSYDDEEWGLFD